jgi:hypothetical protein
MVDLSRLQALPQYLFQFLVLFNQRFGITHKMLASQLCKKLLAILT